MWRNVKRWVGWLGVTGALMACVPNPGAAQEWFVGLKAGVGFWDVSSDRSTTGDSFESENRTGFTGGALVGYRFSSLFSLSAEGLYTQKGFKIIENGDGGGEIEIDVIEIPVLANFHLANEESRFSPRLFGGGWVSFESSCELEVEEVELACDDAPDGTVRKKTDYGLAVGAALDVHNVGPVTLFADGRYLFGLNNIDDGPPADNFNVKTRGFAFSAGASVPLG